MKKRIRKTALFSAWMSTLDVTVAGRVNRRLLRVEEGNYGDHKRFDGLIELRFDFGAGYRVYCVEQGPVLVIVLVGGDKSSQRADIKRAKQLAETHVATE